MDKEPIYENHRNPRLTSPYRLPLTGSLSLELELELERTLLLQQQERADVVVAAAVVLVVCVCVHGCVRVRRQGTRGCVWQNVLCVIGVLYFLPVTPMRMERERSPEGS
jgi:hypothetical protein